MVKKKWTFDEVDQHIKVNSKDVYSMAVVLAGVYKKLYGQLPKMGLSGAQAECAEVVLNKLP